jgi:lipocalin-like protein
MKLLAFSIALLVPAAFGADSIADLQKKFVGSWKLISIEGPNGISTNSVGMVMYDGVGHMSVHIVRGDRPAFPTGRRATDQEKAEAFSSYTAYFGTYTFEPENGIVIHHLEGSLSPGQIGQDNIRYFELQGNRLTLSVANDRKGGRLSRKDTTSHLTWEKIPAK